MYREVKDLSQLAELMPQLVEIYNQVKDRWGMTLSEKDFVSRVFEKFHDGHFYVETPFGQVGFLAFYYPISTSGEVLAWFTFSNSELCSTSKRYLMQISQTLRAHGYKRIIFETSKLTRSYDRFVKTLGAKKVGVIYSKEL